MNQNIWPFNDAIKPADWEESEVQTMTARLGPGGEIIIERIPPLPFDELESDVDSLSLIGRLERYENKRYLMTFDWLEYAGISARIMREYLDGFVLFPRDTEAREWGAWKICLELTTGKSWSKVAEIVYGTWF